MSTTLTVDIFSHSLIVFCLLKACLQCQDTWGNSCQIQTCLSSPLCLNVSHALSYCGLLMTEDYSEKREKSDQLSTNLCHRVFASCSLKVRALGQ